MKFIKLIECSGANKGDRCFIRGYFIDYHVKGWHFKRRIDNYFNIFNIIYSNI